MNVSIILNLCKMYVLYQPHDRFLILYTPSWLITGPVILIWSKFSKPVPQPVPIALPMNTVVCGMLYVEVFK